LRYSVDFFFLILIKEFIKWRNKRHFCSLGGGMYETILTPEIYQWLEKVRVAVLEGRRSDAAEYMRQARTLIDAREKEKRGGAHASLE